VFRPEGYLSLKELMDRVIFHPQLFDRAVKSVTTSSGEHWPDHNGFFDAVEHAVFAFANHFGLWAISLDGETKLKFPIPLPAQSQFGLKQIEMLDVMKDDRSTQLFQRAAHAFGWIPIISHRELIQIDMMRAEEPERKKLNEYPQEMWRFKSGAPYHERGTYTVDNALAEFLFEYGIADEGQFLPVTRQCEGYTLCVQRNEGFEIAWEQTFGRSIHQTRVSKVGKKLDENSQQNLDIVERQVAAAKQEQVSEVLNLGRPRKRDKALLLYDQIFPNGHSGFWQDAVSEIEKKTGFTVSAQTLSKAYNERKKENQTGRNASKTGKKTGKKL